MTPGTILIGAVNQSLTNMIFDTDWNYQYQGPAIKANAKVAVVVADANGQPPAAATSRRYDDRGSNDGGLAYMQDHQSGSIQVRDGFSIAWSMDYNIVTQQQVYTLDSVVYGRRLPPDRLRRC